MLSYIWRLLANKNYYINRIFLYFYWFTEGFFKWETDWYLPQWIPLALRTQNFKFRPFVRPEKPGAEISLDAELRKTGNKYSIV